MDIQAERIAIEAEDKELNALKRSVLQRITRVHERRLAMYNACTHKFTPPMKGYEHEGGQCQHCGINELYASTLASKK